MNSAAAHSDKTNQRSGLRAGFRRWRRSRPFWGGLFTIAAGAEILLFPLLTLPILVQQGIAGISGFTIGILMIFLGLSMWFQPHLRTFSGIATILLALASLITVNLGGFVLGLILGIAGGALAFAWVEARPAPVKEAREPRKGNGDGATPVGSKGAA